MRGSVVTGCAVAALLAPGGSDTATQVAPAPVWKGLAEGMPAWSFLLDLLPFPWGE
jgi:hypothetical protein